MKSMRRLFAMLAVMALVLAACGGDEGGGDAGDLELVTPGTLTVCTDVPYPPMEFEDADSPSGYDGFDIDLIEAVAEDLGLDIAVATPGFEAITGGLAFENDDCDVAAASITITAEREESVDFTDPYFTAEQSLLVAADSGITDLADMDGMELAVQTGTTGGIYAEENRPDGLTIVEFSEAAGPILALEAGEVDGFMTDLVVNQDYVDNNEGFVIAATYETDEEYGFATQDSPNLLAAINESLEKFRSDGTYDEIYATWFPEG